MEEKSRRLTSCGEHGFVAGLEEITAILSRLEPPQSPILQAIDTKAQDLGTYYFCAYCDTRNLDSSLLVYRLVKDLVRVILLNDRFYEVRNKRYQRLGRATLARLQKEDNECLGHSLTISLKQFWPFWKFEQLTKRQMIEGHRFSTGELRQFSLFKSSDACLIYAPLLEFVLPNFSHNVTLAIHYNQALQDMEDDLDDIEEDLREQMPNVFILAALGRGNKDTTFQKLYRDQMAGSKAAIIQSAESAILQLAGHYSASTEGIVVPDQFGFLKYLSREYAKRIRTKLTAMHPSN